MASNAEARDDGDGGQADACCLRVKNLPGLLAPQAIDTLLKHYGASCVRVLQHQAVNQQHKTRTVIVTFATKDDRQRALDRLQQLVLAGNKLRVDVIDDDQDPAPRAEPRLTAPPPPLPPPPAVPVPLLPSRQGSSSPYAPVPLAPHLGLHYAPSPLLEYKYPRATEDVVRNIANALMALPKFYTQVLHLMNKMNIPPPFEAEAIPGVFSRSRQRGFGHQDHEKQRAAVTATEEEEEEEEEEVADDDDGGDDPQRAGPNDASAAEPHANIDMTNKTIESTNNQRPSPAFGGAVLAGKKRKLPLSSSTKPSAPAIIDLAKAFEIGANNTASAARPGVVSLSELERLRLDPQELAHEESRLQYRRGMPTTTVMVWNLAEEVDEADLRFVFGQVLPMDFELSAIQIHLHSEKRYARIRFPNVEIAERAVNTVHGYQLELKPLLVGFEVELSMATISLNDDDENRWTCERLAALRLAPDALASEKAMKNYQQGTPSNVLYVKNLTKEMTTPVLEQVFRVLLPVEYSSISLSIRHFTEGRMKNQAFIEFPSTEIATNTLHAVHGAVFNGKPLVVCFGRGINTSSTSTSTEHAAKRPRQE